MPGQNNGIRLREEETQAKHREAVVAIVQMKDRTPAEISEPSEIWEMGAGGGDGTVLSRANFWDRTFILSELIIAQLLPHSFPHLPRPLSCTCVRPCVTQDCFFSPQVDFKRPLLSPLLSGAGEWRLFIPPLLGLCTDNLLHSRKIIGVFIILLSLQYFKIPG